MCVIDGECVCATVCVRECVYLCVFNLALLVALHGRGDGSGRVHLSSFFGGGLVFPVVCDCFRLSRLLQDPVVMGE